MEKYFPQTEAPAKTDPYYIRKEAGGYSPCIVGKPNIYQGKSTLANCVGYAWGRVAFLLRNPNCKIGCALGCDWPGDAKNWLKNSAARGYETGKTPKLGAVAVWSSRAGGHVAVVEEIDKASGRVIVSESNYRGIAWQLRSLPKSMYINRGLTFLGFIYLPVEWEEKEDKEDDPLSVGSKVRIIGRGNSQADGNGKSAGGVGWTRYIFKIYKGAEYPYRVGFMNGVTTGFYKADALKKI